MMYDDIAHSENNPTQGIVVNHPSGADVYHDVPKDYVGDAVTPEVFLNVLLGNVTALKGKGSGKFIASGPDDHVFVNFADHGAPGLVAFPNGELYARQLLKTFQLMHKMKKYHKMVVYMEACESGSMFSGLLDADINVYATTAANGDESSYACYWDDLRQTYLGDVYSVRWMEDADNELSNAETLADQYHLVKAETNTSHVQQFGDEEIGSHYYVGEFLGTERLSLKQAARVGSVNRRVTPIADAVPAPDVPIHVLEKRIQAAKTPKEVSRLVAQLTELKKQRLLLDDVVVEIVRQVALRENHVAFSSNLVFQRTSITNFDCHERVTPHFSKLCAPLSDNDYALRKVQVFVNLCELGAKTDSIYDAISTVCGKRPPMTGVY